MDGALARGLALSTLCSILPRAIALVGNPVITACCRGIRIWCAYIPACFARFWEICERASDVLEPLEKYSSSLKIFSILEEKVRTVKVNVQRNARDKRDKHEAFNVDAPSVEVNS